jgi:hypothetical protein
VSATTATGSATGAALSFLLVFDSAFFMLSCHAQISAGVKLDDFPATGNPDEPAIAS